MGLNQYLHLIRLQAIFFLMAHFSTSLLPLLLLCSLLQGSDAAVKDVVNFVLDSHLGGGNLTESAVNCIWRNETGSSRNASSLSSTVYCLGSSASAAQTHFFAVAPIL